MTPSPPAQPDPFAQPSCRGPVAGIVAKNFDQDGVPGTESLQDLQDGGRPRRLARAARRSPVLDGEAHPRTLSELPGGWPSRQRQPASAISIRPPQQAHRHSTVTGLNQIVRRTT
jgi:hypothetical protein